MEPKNVVYTTLGGFAHENTTRGDWLTVTYSSVHTPGNGDQTIRVQLLDVWETDFGGLRLTLSGEHEDDQFGVEIDETEAGRDRLTLYKRNLISSGQISGRAKYKSHRMSPFGGVRLILGETAELDRSAGQFYTGDRVVTPDGVEAEVSQVKPETVKQALDLDEPTPAGWEEVSRGAAKKLVAREDARVSSVDDDGKPHYDLASELTLADEGDEEDEDGFEWLTAEDLQEPVPATDGGRDEEDVNERVRHVECEDPRNPPVVMHWDGAPEDPDAHGNVRAFFHCQSCAARGNLISVPHMGTEIETRGFEWVSER